MRIVVPVLMATGTLLAHPVFVRGQAIATLRAHKHTITSLAFTADGKMLASGGKDGVVILWDVAGRKLRARLPGHKDMVSAIAFAPGGKTLASSSHASDIAVWDAETGKQIGTLRGHNK